MLFDNLDDYEKEKDQKNPDESDALRRSFGTKPPAKLKPAHQDDLFEPEPQKRLF